MNKWSLICSIFRHYKSAPFHTVIRIHLISLSYHILVILPSHFSSMEQMLVLTFMFYSQLSSEMSDRDTGRSRDAMSLTSSRASFCRVSAYQKRTQKTGMKML